MIRVFLILFVSDLFLNKKLLLGEVFKLFLGVAVFLAPESLVSRVSDICIRRGEFLSGLLKQFSVV